MEILSQKKQRVICEVLTDMGQTVEDRSEHSDTEKQRLGFEIMTDSGQTVEDTIGYSDTDKT
jgi:hypothetical protein